MQGMNPKMNMVKVSNPNKYNKYFSSKTQGPGNPRYKTMMCKHYNTPQGCSYGDKCQFAHGPAELRSAGPIAAQPMSVTTKQPQRNPLNYKIVKCKNWERDGTCKYGAHCTFAHGDDDLRNKTDNLYQLQPMPMLPICDINGMSMVVPQGVDVNAMTMSMPMMPLGMEQNMQNMYMNMNMSPQQMNLDMLQMPGAGAQNNAEQPKVEGKNA